MKKVFSIIVALALMICIVPATAADAAAGGKLVTLTREPLKYVASYCGGYAYAIQGEYAGYLNEKGTFYGMYKTSDALAAAQETGGGYQLNFNYQMSEEGMYPYFDAATKGWGVKNIKTGAVVIPAQYPNPTIYKCGRAIISRQRRRALKQNVETSV